jgi:hypothetical protein
LTIDQAGPTEHAGMANTIKALTGLATTSQAFLLIIHARIVHSKSKMGSLIFVLFQHQPSV